MWLALFGAAISLLACSTDGSTTFAAAAETSEAGATDAAGDTAAGDAASTHSPAPFPCLEPEPLLTHAGADTGFDRCKGGLVRRRVVIDCAPFVPSTATTCTMKGACASDMDCVATTGGPCRQTHSSSSTGASVPTGCACASVCTTDVDCGAGQICFCGAMAGVCVEASCTTSDECPVGDCVLTERLACALYDVPKVFQCQSDLDGCGTDDDCASDKPYCRRQVDPGGRSQQCESLPRCGP